MLAVQDDTAVASAAKTTAPVLAKPAPAPVDGTQGQSPDVPRQVHRRKPEPPKQVQPQAKLPQLVGMAHFEVSRLLGKPNLMRQEAQAQVWQYADSDCALHLFLYNDRAEGPYRVVHINAVRRGKRVAMLPAGAAAEPFQQHCLRRLLHRTETQDKTS